MKPIHLLLLLLVLPVLAAVAYFGVVNYSAPMEPVRFDWSLSINVGENAPPRTADSPTGEQPPAAAPGYSYYMGERYVGESGLRLDADTLRAEGTEVPYDKPLDGASLRAMLEDHLGFTEGNFASFAPFAHNDEQGLLGQLDLFVFEDYPGRENLAEIVQVLWLHGDGSLDSFDLIVAKASDEPMGHAVIVRMRSPWGYLGRTRTGGTSPPQRANPEDPFEWQFSARGQYFRGPQQSAELNDYGATSLWIDRFPEGVDLTPENAMLPAAKD